jgi:hypothetical protein
MQPGSSSISGRGDECNEIDRLIAEYLDQQDRGEQADRQALAIMEHPNIARILDAGMTPAGHFS